MLLCIIFGKNRQNRPDAIVAIGIPPKPGKRIGREAGGA
jgi:hypothetical protein